MGRNLGSTALGFSFEGKWILLRITGQDLFISEVRLVVFRPVSEIAESKLMGADSRSQVV